MVYYTTSFNTSWDRTTPVLEHIASIRTLETCCKTANLSVMKFMVDPKVLAFILLNSLLKTLEWSTFTSTVINSINEDKPSFDAVETRITSEEAQLNPYRSSDSTLKASNKSGCKGSSATWCKHYQHSGHDSNNCYAYQGARVSKSLIKHVQACLLSEPKGNTKDSIIIDSGATSHMVPHHSGFRSYTLLQTPCLVALGNDVTTHAIGIGNMALRSIVHQQTSPFW
ncbi:hypothetical protein OG21DRAFT_1427916 [Imleria badia]|nr:hypothetical protein OG21DRAFT_1427916 [Imleria badia]